MLLLKLEDVQKLAEKEVLKKVILFSTGTKPVQFKDLGLETEPLQIAPQKELIEAVKTGMKVKKAAKKYLKSVTKNEFGGLSFINVIQIALGQNKVPAIVLNEQSEDFKLEVACLMKVFKYFGVKPVTMKDLKKEKVLKGKKKVARKNFMKLFNDFSIKNDENYAAFKENFRFEILAIDIQNQYEAKDGLNKESRRKYAKRLHKAIYSGKNKKVKKNLKALKQFLNIDNLDMPKMKKVFAGKLSAEELVMIIGHMAVIKSNEFRSDAYFKEMGAIISKLGLETTLKDFKAAVGAEVKATKEK